MNSLILGIFGGILSGIVSSLMPLVLVIVVAWIVVSLIRTPEMKPVVIFLMCFAWLVLAVYSSFTWYRYNNTRSRVLGEPEIVDPYEDFNFFEYDLDDIVWYESNGTYYYEETYATSIKFNGDSQDKYQLLVNNTPCWKTTSTNGRLQAFYKKQFKNIEGEITTTVNFTIDFAFYSSRIELKITLDATKDNIGTVREFVDVNGFNLRIIDTVYHSTV